MPPNTQDTKVDETLSRELEQLDLKTLVREQGFYGVHPEVYYPPLQPFEHSDPGHSADASKASLLNAAKQVFDVTPNIGTEIHGIQLSQLDEQQKNDLALLVAERGVVFFRQQDLTAKQALDFGRYFGRLHVHNVGPHPPNAPEILTIQVQHDQPKVRERYASRSAGDGWHSDISYEQQPAGLTFLKIDTLPPVGGDTLWASGYTAYDRLSPAWQTFLEGLQAVHSGDVHRETARVTGHPLRREAPDNIHPVVRTHPVTGWKSLYVQRGFTRRIVGFTQRESDAVLQFLYSHIESGYDFHVRFKWEEDSIAVWDNRATYHTPIHDYFGTGIRHGFRVTPTAERPYFDPASKSRQQALQPPTEIASNERPDTAVQ